MNTFKTRREWLLRSWRRIGLLGAFGVVWAGLANLAMYRSLNVVCCSLDGKPMTLGGQFLINALGGTPGILVACFLFAITMGFTKRSVPFWLISVCVAVVGTPIAFFGGRLLAGYLWAINRGGTPWEEIVPVAVGFLVGCLMGLFLENCFRRSKVK